jgi:CRISPR-associated protein Csh2
MPKLNGQDILFLYECKDNNPNGDPLDDNRPRLDAETGTITVSDARIKRTIRDYLDQAKNEEILIRDSYNEKGFLKQGKDRSEDFFELAGIKKQKKYSSEDIKKLEKAVTSACIDARLFGAVLPLGEGSVSVQLTGPTQFNSFNRSLNEVSVVLRQGTAAYAGKEGAMQKTFSERYIAHYALLAVEGLFNCFAAESTEAGPEDLEKLYAALWNGTKWLTTHSKTGQIPVALIVVEYKDGYRLGDLAGRIKLQSSIEGKKIRSMDDYLLDMHPLLQSVDKMHKKGRINRVRVQLDERLKTVPENIIEDWKSSGVLVEEFDF